MKKNLNVVEGNKNNQKILKNPKNDFNIVVNTIQLKNPILKEFFFFGFNSDPTIPCDFKIAEKYFCFFLSMKYHKAFPTYIENKLAKANITIDANSNNNNQLKFLFCICDLTNVEDSQSENNQLKIYNYLEKLNVGDNNSEEKNLLNEDNIFFNLSLSRDEVNSNTTNKSNVQENQLEKLLTDLNFICLNHNVTFILCYSGYDLAQYIYSLSQMHNNDYGQEKIKSLTVEDDLIDTISIIDKINKTDAQNLLSNFQDIKSIVNSSSQLLSLVPGMNNKKIKSIEEFYNFEFSKFKNSE